MRKYSGFRLWVLAAIVAFISGCGGLGGQYAAGDADSLVNAVEIDDVGAVRSAVSRGTSPNQRIAASGYSSGAPLLALAARAGAVQVVRYLISAGADINARTPVNETPLMLAAYFHEDAGSSAADRHDEAMRILVQAGAQLENLPHQYTPLAYAAYNNRQRALRFLIEHGARLDADARDRVIYVNTPLMMAAIQGHLEIVRMLLRAGADPLVRVHLGSTAREFAHKNRHTHIEPLLACAESLPSGQRYSQYCEGPNVAIKR